MPQPKNGEKDAPKAATRAAAPADEHAPVASQTSENPELDDAVQEAQDQGYWGVRETEYDDEEFALTTGPDSPGAPVL